MQIEPMLRVNGMTMDDVDRWLGDADLEAMRAQVRREESRILGRFR